MPLFEWPVSICADSPDETLVLEMFLQPATALRAARTIALAVGNANDCVAVVVNNSQVLQLGVSDFGFRNTEQAGGFALGAGVITGIKH